jgi:hypothetical protein
VLALFRQLLSKGNGKQAVVINQCDDILEFLHGLIIFILVIIRVLRVAFGIHGR